MALVTADAYLWLAANHNKILGLEIAFVNRLLPRVEVFLWDCFDHIIWLILWQLYNIESRFKPN